ncbi:MAG: TVP38/TMEM64 family protein, partial [Verrucomicrobiales bacterium]
MRFIWISVGLAVLLMIPFLLWDETFTRMFSGDEMVAALRAQGALGWIVGILLLIADIFLPIPGTAVMAALGFVYGPVIGGTVSATGSFLAGMLAYGLSRGLGHGIALKLAGKADLEKGERLFARSGAWIVALSRCLPLLPEVVAC